MISPNLAARVFAVLVAGVSIFQLALALGAPWGDYAMGGLHPGVLPPAMRIAALVQIGILGAAAFVLLVRARPAAPGWTRPAAWAVVGLSALSAGLNLITPSGGERIIWAPVAILLLACAVRVAAAR